MPAFPFHGWMPDGYRSMPLPALAVFSGVLSKVAAYGFLKVVLPLFPTPRRTSRPAADASRWPRSSTGRSIAFTTTDVRLVLGYSSVAQLGFIMLGIFALRDEGAQGAVLQMVNHGLVVAPMFFIVALAGGAGRRLGGPARHGRASRSARPCSPSLFLIVALATLAMPGSANFVGEFLILLGVFKAKLAIALIASAGVALASVYALRAFIRAVHNRPGEVRRVARDRVRRGGHRGAADPARACLRRLSASRARPGGEVGEGQRRGGEGQGVPSPAGNAQVLPPGVTPAGTDVPAQPGVPNQVPQGQQAPQTQVVPSDQAPSAEAQAQGAQPQVQVQP